MRAQNRKAFNNIMKSPSPDIAHRSIITNTKSPANEIKEFMRIRQSSTSPKSMTASFHQINKSLSDNDEVNRLRRHIQQLQGRIKYLQRIKISHQQLAIINQRLNGEIESLKMKLRDSQQRSQSNSSRNISPINGRNPSPRTKGVSLVRNQQPNNNINISISQNPSAISIPAPTDNILRQFNDRITKMSQENKRLSNKLREINNQKENLQRQNSSLKSQKVNDNRPTEASSSENVQSLKRYFAEEANKITKYYQELNESRMINMGSRMNGLQNQVGRLTQRTTKRLGINKTSSPHEMKGNVSIDTNFRSQSHQQPQSSLQANRYYMAESKYTTSPSEFKTVTLDTSPIRVLQQEKERMRRENEGLNRKTVDIQSELKKVLLENNTLQKRLRDTQSALNQAKSIPSNKLSTMGDSNISTYKANQQKIQALQHQNVTKNFQLKFKTLQIQELQKRLREISMFRETEAEDNKRIITQERQKSIHYLQQLQKCQQKLTDLQKSSINKQLLHQLQEQLLKIKILYEQTLSQHTQLKTNFNKYLQMVMEIRHSLTGNDMNECIKDIQNKWTGYDELQMQIIKVHQCHQLLIQEYKQSILQKQQHIAKLQKKNLLLKQQNQQNVILVQKLQKAIYDYSQPSRSIMSEQEIKKRFNHHQSAEKRSGNPCVIRDYINRTDSKLGELENEINLALQLQSQYKNIRSNNNKRYTPGNNNYPFSPNQVESVYRKTITQQQQVREYSDAEQYDGQHDQIPDEYELMGRE